MASTSAIGGFVTGANMGEARRRKQRLERLINHQPWCVYCGATALGVSIDHMPPITVFDSRDRPKELEFLACDDCNQGTKGIDQAVGFLSRVYGVRDRSGAQREIAAAISGVRNNIPGLLEEMEPTEEQKSAFHSLADLPPDAAGVFNASGPILNRIMYEFAAKAGMALHFQKTGQVLPRGGYVAAHWFANFQAMYGQIPAPLLAQFPLPSTLTQGQKTVADQFEYASVVSAEGNMWAHIATFRHSFAVYSVTAPDSNVFADLRRQIEHDGNVMRIFQPGCFKRG